MLLVHKEHISPVFLSALNLGFPPHCRRRRNPSWRGRGGTATADRTRTVSRRRTIYDRPLTSVMICRGTPRPRKRPDVGVLGGVWS